MSLMLDALKRIETKQSRSSARESAEPASEQEPSSVLSTQYPVPKSLPPEDAAPPEPSSVLSAQDSVPKSLPPEDSAPPEPASLDGAIETDLQSVATEVEPIEIPPALAADDLPSMPLDDFALPEAGSPGTMYPWSAAIDQLQAYVAEAGLLYDSEPEVERAEPPDAELPWVEVLPSLPAVAEEPAPAVEAPPPMWEIELDGPVAEFTEKPNSPEAKLPVIAPAALDPYAATAQAILRQLPRDRSQVLLFTSAADGQGKTMTLARLAPWLAQGMEGNVLVVDANFRNPDLARWLAVAPAWRLPDVLAGTADWSAAVQATADRCVSLLPGGSDAQGRGAGRNVQGMSRLLRDLAGHYDLVVVDAPSLAHRGTVQLAAVCDGTYLVARLGDGSPRMLREAAQVVPANGGRLLGCVAIDAE